VEVEDAVAEYLRDADVPLHRALLVSARRKLERGDFRGSVIDSICAVEATLDPFLRREMVGLGVNENKLRDFLGPKGASLADRVNVLLPMVAPSVFSQALREAFAAANSKRNNIVHRGEGAGAGEARMHLHTCAELVLRLSVVPASHPPIRH
jgi:hypothetical protein